jgi:hypothetical protein
MPVDVEDASPFCIAKTARNQRIPKKDPRLPHIKMNTKWAFAELEDSGIVPLKPY